MGARPHAMTANEDGYSAVLTEYASIASAQRPRDLEESALRNTSSALRDVVAHLASGGACRFEELVASPPARLDNLDPLWTAALGRVVGLQGLVGDADEHALATRLLGSAVQRMSPRSRTNYVRLLIELHFARGEFQDAKRWLDFDEIVAAMGEGYLATDLANHFTASPFADAVAWRAGFERRFSAHGIAAPAIRAESASPFDGFTLPPSHSSGRELISVVMTTWSPNLDSLTTSVASILNQTWSDLELIVVDDCSPAEYRETLDVVSRLDSRIRLISAERNGGTYLARNIGIAAARGRFVAGQDDDDWSHPERLEQQVEPLLSTTPPPATRSKCITMREDLVMQRPGYDPLRPNASSLMFPRNVARDLGGFMHARRAADTEFHERLEVHGGRPVVTCDVPLTLVRIRTDSLSRSDFRPGWHHPARRAFRSAFGHWHRTAGPDALIVAAGSAPIAVPERFAVEPRGHVSLDTVVVVDWRFEGQFQRAAIEEIHALLSAGQSVGVLQVESSEHLSRRNDPLSAPVQDLINEGVITRVLDDEEVDVRLLLVRDPAVLQFPTDQPFALRAQQVVAVVDEPYLSVDGRRRRYDLQSCARHGDRLFGRLLWTATSTPLHDALEAELPLEALTAGIVRHTLDPRRWATERVSFRSDRPVVGYHGALPQTHQPIPGLDDGSIELRYFSPGRTAAGLLVPTIPVPWLHLGSADLPLRAFLNGLDFYVYFPGLSGALAYQDVAEAVATGLVVILPTEYKHAFGSAALYSRVEEVAQLVHSLRADLPAYRAQATAAHAWAEQRLSPSKYLRALEALVS